MQPDAASPDSRRAATNGLLLDLRTRGWRPRAWAQLLGAATTRSTQQAVTHRRALGQVTALHGLSLVVGPGSRRRWVATSWALTALHLGMLENRSQLGVANTLTLVRANLPVTGTASGRWLGMLALTTEFVDGRLARLTGTSTPFGRFADPLADTALWTWLSFTLTGRGSRAIRVAVPLTWLSPLLSVTIRGVSRGQMIEPPRPRWIRPAVILQIVIATRVAHGQRPAGNPGAPRPTTNGDTPPGHDTGGQPSFRRRRAARVRPRGRG